MNNLPIYRYISLKTVNKAIDFYHQI